MSDIKKFNEESDRFSASGDSHDLPEIANWFSENILKLKLLEYTGSKSFKDLVLQEIKKSRKSNSEFILVSLGAGHGQIEGELLNMVPQISPGPTHFYSIDLFSPNDSVETKINGHCYKLTRNSQDLNTPVFPKNANMIIVHHALHHFVALEEIFKSIHEILLPNLGTLVIADMVGRNGHMRWPESLRAINRIWDALPKEKHYNNQFHKMWETFENWDCSNEGFEGIRSEDILKPLFRYFESDKTFFWGGILDPFIDRGFGDNFDPNNEKDIEIIEKIMRVETKLTEIGILTATQVIGSFIPRKVPLTSSFSNLLISKKYFGDLMPNAQKHIDGIVDSVFDYTKKTPKLVDVKSIIKNKDLKQFLMNGWDTSDPAIIWGVGLESKMAFSLPEGVVTGLLIECSILDRAKFGLVQVMVNSEITITQQLASKTLIHLPQILIDTLEIRISFAEIDTFDANQDKRLITFQLSSLTFFEANEHSSQMYNQSNKLIEYMILGIKHYLKRKLTSIKPNQQK